VFSREPGLNTNHHGILLLPFQTEDSPFPVTGVWQEVVVQSVRTVQIEKAGGGPLRLLLHGGQPGLEAAGKGHQLHPPEGQIRLPLVATIHTFINNHSSRRETLFLALLLAT